MSANQFQNNKLHAFNTIKRKTGIFLATFLLILPAFFGVAEAAGEGKIKLGATVAPGVSMPDGTGIAAIAATEIFR